MPRHARSTSHERKALTALSGGLTGSPPDPPTGLLVETVALWHAFWESDQARLIQRPMLPALERLHLLYDERARCYRSVRRARLVKGSKGQPRRSPLFDVISGLDAQIGRLEEQFGLTPKSWIALGGALGDATRSLADLNADLDADDADDDAADPRLLVVDGRAG